jgi:two-component system nitrate/nitrite response regulator NarL
MWKDETKPASLPHEHTMLIKLVLADQHPIMLTGLKKSFLSEKDFKILACCTTGKEALNAVRKKKPHVLVLDVGLPVKNGLVVLGEIASYKIQTRSVIFTAGLSDDELLKAIRLGVSGIVLKTMPAKLLIQCIRKVHAGEKWFEQASAARALENLTDRERTMRLTHDVLSSRQRQIIRMVAMGLRNRDIGKQLFITNGTVQTHLHNIYKKLDIKSRLALALYARDNGLL